jgi:hypothetical protein
MVMRAISCVIYAIFSTSPAILFQSSSFDMLCRSFLGGDVPLNAGRTNRPEARPCLHAPGQIWTTLNQRRVVMDEAPNDVRRY